MSSTPTPEGVPPGAPFVPQGPVPFIATTNPNTMDYPRLVYTAPRFEVVAIADIIEPSVLEACEALLPTLVPPYVNQAAIDAVNATAVRRAGDTMTGPLNLSPVIPTANAMAASKQYVDTMIATGAVPEVPPVPAGQAWARETGQWVPIAGGGTVTNIATGAGLTGGPITATGIISMANMAANSLKGNATGAVAAPTDIPAGTVLTMIGGAALNSPNFTGTPTLPTGTTGVTQSGGTSNTTLATTAFVANTVANYAPLVSPVFTGAPSLPTGAIAVTQVPGDADTSIATTAFVAAAVASYLPLTGGTLAGPGNLTVRGGILAGAAGTVPASGNLTLNANTVAPQPGQPGNLSVIGSDGNNVTAVLDSYGTGASNIFVGRHARGTAAAPSAVQATDILLALACTGYAATGYGGFGDTAIWMEAAENFTATAQGTRMRLTTFPTGTTGAVNSLVLQGNSATFSGNVTEAGNYYYFVNATGSINGPSTGPYIYADNNAIAVKLGSATPSLGFVVQAQAGSTNFLLIDNNGNLTISGPIGTKASGTAWSNPSSRDLKTNVKPYEAGLQAVLALQPRTWDFAADSGIDAPGPHIGLIHDETAHMPEMHRKLKLSSGETPREVDGLDCSAVTWALVNAIKELKTELKELKTELDALKAGSTP